VADRRRPEPERDLLWRTRAQGSIRRGRYKLLVDRTAQSLLRRLDTGPGERVRLFDVASDGWEKADLSGGTPQLAADLLADWRAFDTSLLAYPPPPRPHEATDGESD
jgi:arylsulfatase A-like enzyme